MAVMNQEQINVDLFDEVNRLQGELNEANGKLIRLKKSGVMVQMMG